LRSFFFCRLYFAQESKTSGFADLFSVNEQKRAKRWAVPLFLRIPKPKVLQQLRAIISYQLRSAAGIAAFARWHFRSYV